MLNQPNLVLVKIFKYLDIPSKLALIQSCKKYYNKKILCEDISKSLGDMIDLEEDKRTAFLHKCHFTSKNTTYPNISFILKSYISFKCILNSISKILNGECLRIRLTPKIKIFKSIKGKVIVPFSINYDCDSMILRKSMYHNIIGHTDFIPNTILHKIDQNGRLTQGCTFNSGKDVRSELLQIFSWYFFKQIGVHFSSENNLSK